MGNEQSLQNVRQSESDTRRDQQESRTCPECDGRIVRDSGTAETVCQDCGLVIDDREIDTGPEWRAYDAEERDEKSRIGSPTTPLIHDKGLSTTIGWQDRDAHGQTLSSRRRQQLGRLRTWDERFRIRDSQDRNLSYALGEIDRMASALGIPEPTRETASVLYRRALEHELLPGRSIESMATASLYAAARLEGIPRSISEVTAVSRVEEITIKRAYRYLARELELEIPPASPIEYLGRFASELECTDETERLARELLETGISQGVHSGKDPVGIAAGALYAAGQLTNERITQSAVSAVANVSEVTIRNRYPEIVEAFEEGDER